MRENLMDSVGVRSAVLELIDFVPDSRHFEFYVEIVKEKDLLRQIISTCTSSINSAYTHEGDASHILDEVEQNILDIGEDIVLTGTIDRIKNSFTATTLKLKKNFKNG